MSERGSETAGESPAAQQAASERRTIEAAGRNRKLAAAALMRLGGDCPPQLEEVGKRLQCLIGLPAQADGVPTCAQRDPVEVDSRCEAPFSFIHAGRPPSRLLGWSASPLRSLRLSK